ncbi:uncharacterized protein [Castor canadensis]|uniref:Uncharacterized protein n=1 Tax=Castor canadensis TaxID=51338 RepID=A0AC58K1X6_CASCN
MCPPGHSCPPGSQEPWPCSPGQYQDKPGQSFCKMCPAGKSCPFVIQEQGARPMGPVDCPAGYYCPLGTQSPTQHPCPGGTFREKPGARSIKDCRPCPAGQFCADSGAGKRLPDGLCSTGYYCPPGQTSATPMSFRCPQGFYCPEGSPQPRAYENGTFQPQEAQSSCEPCPVGFYCKASITGMFCSLEGLPQPSGLCHSGHYCTGGAISPTPIKHKAGNSGPLLPTQVWVGSGTPSWSGTLFPARVATP